jgi:hypothetical protein
MADRRCALLHDRKEADEGPRDAGLVGRVAKIVAIHTAFIGTGHRPDAAVRPEAHQRTGDSRIVGSRHDAVVVDVAALAGVTDAVGRRARADAAAVFWSGFAV